jgi:hypothetical protein
MTNWSRIKKTPLNILFATFKKISPSKNYSMLSKAKTPLFLNKMWGLYYFLGLYYAIGLPLAGYAGYQEWCKYQESLQNPDSKNIEMTVFYADKQASCSLAVTNSISHSNPRQHTASHPLDSSVVLGP